MDEVQPTNEVPELEPDQLAETDVAVIGMAGHFPGGARRKMRMRHRTEHT